MRWLYYDRESQAEAAEHSRLLAGIDAFWRALSAKTADLSALFTQQKQWDLPGWMLEHLEPIDARICWEYGPAVHGEGHRLVITPEQNKDLRPLVATMIQRAPRIAGWEFYAYRLPESADVAQHTVEGRTGGSLAGVQVEAKIGEHNLIDLLYRGPRTQGQDDEQAINDAFVATETLLGEEVLDKWVGLINAVPLKGGLRGLFSRSTPGSLIPLAELKERADALIGSLQDQLPSLPYHQRVDELGWSLFELQPDEHDDYPEQFDLFVGKSADQAFWQATHCGRYFSSERFSRCGETFCYVKVDGSEGLENSSFGDKSDIEDALDAALRPANLGCQIGGGTCLRYTYVDLALTDLDRGLATVRKVLREGNAPNRTWIQFYDSDLMGEWLGIHPDTPPPPMMPTEEA